MSRTKTKAKAKGTTVSERQPGGLVATQREAIAKVKTKRALARLAVKLAAQHGTAEQQALKRGEIEGQRRDEIEALVEELAVKAHQRKKAHLSELGGWPVCWSDEKQDSVKPEEFLVTPITALASEVTCSRCKKAAELPSPEETVALQRAEAEAEQPGTGKRAPKRKGEPRRAKRQLALTKNLPVRLKVKGLEVKGVVRPDGTMSVKGKSYASPHAAANELAGDLVAYRIDGFQAWRYQDEEGRWRMLRDHS